MADLSVYKPPRGSRRRKRRVGRGPGSGTGTYAGKGVKGQKARAGRGPRPGFEGGQTPLVKRLPFRRGVRAAGANRVGGKPKPATSAVNVGVLNRFAPNSAVTPETLREAGLARGVLVKILGGGSLDRALAVRAHAFSAKAKAAIEAAGGSWEITVDGLSPALARRVRGKGS